MERLTKTYSDGTHAAADNLPCGENSYTYKGLLLEALGKYEDAEEQGLMVRLPVPIGTTVYEFEPLNKIVKGCTARTVIKYTMYDDSIWFNFADGYMKDIKDFGKTVFLTREVAEQKLKEMNTDNSITEQKKKSKE